MTADVILTFFHTESWDDARRRGMGRPPDRLAQRLLGDPRVRKVIVADPYRSGPVRLGKAVLRGPQAPFPTSDRHRILQPLRLRRTDPGSIPGLQRTYRSYGRRLANAARRLGMERPSVVTVNPFLAGFAPLDWASSVTYYARDDWAVHPAMSRWRAGYEEAYERMRRQEVRVAAVSTELLNRLQPEHATVIPNGVDADEWLHPDPPPSWFGAMPTPRMVYAGTLDGRLDVAAIQELADRFTRGSVILIGPVADRDHLRPLYGIPNVHLPGTLPRPLVAAIVHACELCLLPHRDLPLTRAMSPLKLYEYLAGGRPVVASDLPPVADLGEPRIVLARCGEPFTERAVRALELGPLPEAARLRFIRANRWEQRHETLLRFAVDGYGADGQVA